MFELKPLHPEAVPKAMQKAERYRLLNEPEEAESICLDILAVDAGNQEARITLLLSLTEQFRHDCADNYSRARELIEKLEGQYEKCYYAGLICERRGNAQLDRSGPGAGDIAYNWYREAMDWYEQAEAIRPPQNDDAILRWNTCARMIMRHHLTPTVSDTFEPVMLE